MAYRGSLALTLSMAAAAGCSSFGHKEAAAVSGTPVDVVPPGAHVKKEADLPKRTPKASTCVAFGNFIAAEAAAVNQSPDVRRQKIDSGFKAYQQALELDPKNLDARLGLARLQSTAGDLDKAAATYEQALKLHPDNPAVWHELGMNRSRKKDWDAALKALAKAATLAPDNAQYANSYGFALARAGRYDDSVACFTKIHGEAKAHYNLARMLAHLEQPELCKTHLQTALTKDPRLESAKTLLAQLDAAPGATASAPNADIVRTATPIITDVQAVPSPLPSPPHTFTPPTGK